MFDGVVYMASCDKIIPAMLNAAARIDLPSVIVTAGPCFAQIKPNESKELRQRFLRGEITERQLIEGTLKYYTGPGVCPFLGTANTMGALCESLGMMLPGSSLILGRPSFWQLGLYYGILSACLWMGKKRNGKKKSLVQKMLPAAAVFLLFPFPARGLTVTFLDVGQGDGICLQTRQGVILSDCGSSDQKNLGEYRLEPFLKSRGIGAVDYAIVSHGDQDHISGISWLLEQEEGIFIRKLVLPAAGKEDEACVRLAKQAALRGCQVLWMGRGDCLRMGNLSLTCLYPDGLEAGAPLETDRNEHSLVLWLDYGSFDMVLTGDMSKKGEQAILENRGVREQAEVLKAAHHGSRFSSSEAWLDALSPGQAVISCGEKNRYGHPHAEVLERLRKRGITVYETRSCGAVELYTDGKRMRWETWLK